MGIKLFMWGYQQHFRSGAQVFANAVFNELDKNLKPKVFLVGILSEEREYSHPICIEPEDGPYNPGMFNDFQKIVESMEILDKRSRMFYSEPNAEKRIRRKIKLNALKNAIQHVIRQFDGYYNVKSFCSSPVLVEGYMVSTVLQLDLNAFNSHYSLSIKEKNMVPIRRSLLRATIEEYLKESEKALREPDPGTDLEMSGRYPDEIIRTAGRWLMRTPPLATWSLNGLYGLFEACNNISKKRYEGEDGKGKIVITRQDHPNIKTTLSLNSPVKLHDYGAVRKLLEMSSNKMCLLSDSYEVYGLGELVGDYDHTKEDLFVISFTEHYKWELTHGDYILMKTSCGQPHLPKVQIDKEKFNVNINRIFKDTTNSDNVEKLWELIKKSVKQEHGTMIVISENAKSEAERLKSQCTVIKPVELVPSIVQLVTSIDGAVLIDQNGICYAIGVILDGMISNKGTSSRGARYNSAIQYIEAMDSPCLAVVISEDGLIDLIPDLMPQIHRYEIENALSTLRNLNNPEEDSGKFYKTMGWLDKHRFYLYPEVCAEINQIKEVFEDKMREKGITIMIYPNFKPNEEMNDSYFFEGE